MRRGEKNPQRWYQHACEIIITRSFPVQSRGVKDNERQTAMERRAEMDRSRRGIKGERESKASDAKGESLNLSSSLWVQNERRIVGWITGAKLQKELSCSSSMFWRWADYLPDSLPDRKICNHDSLASEWSYCGPVGHLIYRVISSLNRRKLYQFLLIIKSSSLIIFLHRKRQWWPQSCKHLQKKTANVARSADFLCCLLETVVCAL